MKKEWDDARNQDGKRPETAKVTLYKTPAGGTAAAVDTLYTDVAVPYATDNATIWDEIVLPVYENGKVITYSVEETLPDGSVYTKDTSESYTAEEDGSGTITIKNSFTPEQVTVILTKTWSDAADASGRPTAADFAGYLTLSGYSGQKMTDPTANDNRDGTYTVTWNNLPKYQPGQVGTEIRYSVSESEIPLYASGTVESDETTTDSSQNKIGYKVTNTRKTAQVYLGKQVTGNMGDRSATFHFTVAVKGADGTTSIIISGVNSEDVDITRQHGNATLLGPAGTVFPVGATVTIEETPFADYTITSGTKEGTDGSNADEGTTTSTVTFVVAEAGNTVTFYNDKRIDIDTGVPVDQMPYLLMIAAVMLLGVVSLVGYRSRKKRFE